MPATTSPLLISCQNTFNSAVDIGYVENESDSALYADIVWRSNNAIFFHRHFDSGSGNADADAHAGYADGHSHSRAGHAGGFGRRPGHLRQGHRAA